MSGVIWELSTDAFVRITRQNLEDEHDLIRNIVLDDSKTLKMLDYVYNELNILDKKMVQLLAFDASILVATGVLLKIIGNTSSIHQWIVVLSMIIAAISTLLSAVPGVVWGTSWAMRHQEGKGSIAAVDLKKEMVLELIDRKLKRTKRYNWSVLFSTAAIAFLALSCALFPFF